MTIAVIRDQNNDIIVGNLCVFGRSNKKPSICIMPSINHYIDHISLYTEVFMGEENYDLTINCVDYVLKVTGGNNTWSLTRNSDQVLVEDLISIQRNMDLDKINWVISNISNNPLRVDISPRNINYKFHIGVNNINQTYEEKNNVLTFEMVHQQV